MREKSFDEEILEEERQKQQLRGKIDDGMERKVSGEEDMEEAPKIEYGRKEKNTRKNVIKNIAIVFLVIMLILTLFSNTIMNYSLVEVSTQMVYGDSLTSKVRGSGVVEAGENYSVTVKDTRKIATVNVKTNAEVEQGDVLLTFAESESEELTTKRQELKEAEAAYETAVITAGITVAQRNAIESGKSGSLAEKQALLAAAQTKVDNAQARVNTLTSQANASGTVDTSKEEAAFVKAQQDKIAADAVVSQAQENVENTRSTYEALQNEGASEEEIQNARAAYEAAVSAYVTAQQNVIVYEQAVTNAQNALSDKTADKENTELIQAQKDLETAQSERDKVSEELLAQISLSGQYESLADLREEVAEMEEEAVSGEITSPIAGTVTEIFYTAGQTVQKDDIVMTIQPENKAFVIKFSVTADEAKRIKTGDEATILNNWYGADISATVASVRKNSSDQTQYDVTCTLTGDVSVGTNYTLSIGEKSANYDYVVPTSCIREDSNGKFILIVEAKSTPLGNRYYARHVQVEVLASNDTYSAISGAIEAGEYVITTTSKPVSDNQQVRLAD